MAGNKEIQRIVEAGIDIITAGFPCQDISYAGKGAGLEGARSGLWFDALDTICMVGPRFALLENVPALLNRGMGEVLGGLAEGGYDAQWGCVSAADVGAPHRRDRVFILAYAEGYGSRIRKGRDEASRDVWQLPPWSCGEVVADAEGKPGEIWLPKGERQGRFASSGQDVADTNKRFRQRTKEQIQTGRNASGIGGEVVADTEREGERSRVARAIRAGIFVSGRMGRNYRNVCWAVEPDVGRVADGVPARVDRLRALGNAVVPQVAEYVGERLIEWLGGTEQKEL